MGAIQLSRQEAIISTRLWSYDRIALYKFYYY